MKMAEGGGEATAPPPPPPKRSLFKRPAWAQTASSSSTAKASSPAETTPDKPDENLFSRSDQFDIIVAERERKKAAKAEKKRAKEEKVMVDREARDKRSGKRRRISDLDYASDEVHSAPSGVRMHDEVASAAAAAAAAAATKTTTNLDTNDSGRHGRLNIIELGDSDDEYQDAVEEPVSSYTQQPTPPSISASARPSVVQSHPVEPTNIPSDPDSESDEELAEIKRRARQKVREDRERLAKQGQDPTPPPDPKVQLFITSPIPGTKPLVVTRRLSQRLQEVREAWCNRPANLPPDVHSSDVFLTYRLRRLWDVTTCKSLGVKLNAQGRIIPDEKDWADDDETGFGGEHEGKIHLEAVTEALWHQMRKNRRSGRTGGSFLANSAGSDAGGINGGYADGSTAAAAAGAGAGAEEEVVAMETEKEDVIRITMRAKGLKDVKLKVKPSTPFERIAKAARHKFGQQRPIGADEQVCLVFDGEPLDAPGGQIKDTEIEDMDGIEVHFK